MSHQLKLMSRVIQHLDTQEWNYDLMPNSDNIIVFPMNIESKLQKCRVLIVVSDSGIQVHAISPINATKDVYDNVVEFITRANYSLKLGAFEFDYRDGEIRFHTCLPCFDSLPSDAVLAQIIHIPILMMQRYGNGLVKNLMGYGNPAADIEAIEE